MLLDLLRQHWLPPVDLQLYTICGWATFPVLFFLLDKRGLAEAMSWLLCLMDDCPGASSLSLLPLIQSVAIDLVLLEIRWIEDLIQGRRVIGGIGAV